jgi:glycosyltransferase involved in cell wall biosynthesis
MESDHPRIAFYLNHLEIGGAETIFVELSRGFTALGYKVDFVLIQAKGPLLSQLPQGSRIVNLDAHNAYLGLIKLVRYFQSESPDVIMAITELTGLVAIISRWIARVRTRIVIVLATTISQNKRSPLKKKIERILVSRLYPKADEIVAVSRGTAVDFAEYTGIPLNRTKVIYSPFITPHLHDESEKPANHEFFLDREPLVILGVGRLSEPKNFSLLIRAFGLVRRQMQARLLILGDGEERANLERLVRLLGLESDVSLPGFLPSPFPYMKRAAVFVLSSLWEGLPGVLIEALACGAPVVSTDCLSGPSEILDGGKYGHLVPKEDVEALANAIIASLKGDHRKPPASWLDQFKSEHVVKEYLKILGLSS